ncbi:Leucine-rich repeat-containing protein 29 [Pseudolycoriella hygida]|uniref:Leucine-rich repeat-containing protein 29 n=1 Tax=Pseudolycoriella hygida TaxID=35572 RepID=A0A9Q0NG16_9DIPT|nr:Leucine-rich repeat-containing protein 29 [Pseudolycoriella hygida]
MEVGNYVPTYCGSSYTDLPMEIILKILGYLDASDLYVASLTCHRWFEASQHINDTQKLTINFTKIHFADNSPPANCYLNCLRNYAKIVLNNVDFGATEEFWNRCSDSIQEIAFLNCDLREKYLNAVLKNVNNLNALHIENCRELFMPGRLFDKDRDKKAICQACRNVTSLTLSHNRYLSDALFHRFVTIMPKLSSLDLSGCHISFHQGLYRKFYPDSQKDASESVLTFHYIFQFIECEAKSIKSLNFSTTLIDGAALTSLSEISDLSLEVLRLNSCDQLTNTGIISLVQKQLSLVELDLTSCVRLTDPGLMAICSSLTALKILKLRKCRAITDLSVKEIATLNLQILDISECEAITGRGIADGIAKSTNVLLKELYVSALNICEMSIIQIAENIPNLRVLDLSFCKNGVTNLAVQLIFKHLVWLRVLKLDYCDKISDAALTGFDMNTHLTAYEDNKLLISGKISSKEDVQNERNNADNESLRNAIREALNSSNPNERHPFKISLRSKAEEEIVNDAKRKKVMLEMYEHNDANADYSGFSINRAKGLKTLTLTACNKITDVSLKYAFRLLELRELSLSKCQQISSIGMDCLVKNCPSLEILNLSECHNISDKTIEMITIHLKRLTHLYLERCTLLSDHSLDHIAVNCTALKYIDVRSCRAMCSEPNLRLVNVTTLQHISMSKPGPYLVDTDLITMKRPRPPPMPLAF